MIFGKSSDQLSKVRLKTSFTAYYEWRCKIKTTLIEIRGDDRKLICSFSVYKDGSGNSVKQGNETLWYSNGRKQMQMTWKNSELNGEFFEWYDNGKVKIESHLKDGKQHGSYKIYDRSGKLVHESDWLNGKSKIVTDELYKPMESIRTADAKDLFKRILENQISIP